MRNTTFTNIFYRISQLALELAVRILTRPKIFGRENIPDPPYIIASNHESYADPPLVGMAFRKHYVDFMAKQELFDQFFVGAWIRNVNVIPVKRGRHSGDSLKEALRRIRKGRVVAVFPEGTRSKDGEFQEAQAGTGFIISKAHVPVVPVYIANTGRALPRDDSKVHKSTEVKVFVGKPVPPEELILGVGKKKDYKGISDLVMKKIADIKRDVEG